MDGKKVEKIVLFMGAGVAVPLGLPTTVEFMAGIKEGQQTVTGWTTPDFSDGLISHPRHALKHFGRAIVQTAV